MVLENRCTLPLQSTLFSLVAHPSDALFAVGYSNGVVETFRTPSEKNGLVKSVWRTGRHKGSCRCLDFSSNGNDLYSAGTDMILKHCLTETGVVVSKMALSGAEEEYSDQRREAPTSLCALSPDHLLLGTDSGALYVFDIRQNGAVNPKPVAKFLPHGDYVSSITPLPPSDASASGFPRQWVTTGETTVAYTDLRRGVVERSEDQGDELLCAGLVPSGLGPKKKRDNPVLLVGGNSGVVTMWDHGSWDDQQDRINVCAGGKGAAARNMAESVDCVAYVPEDLGWGHYAMAGASDGNIYQINLKRKAVELTLKHDEEDGVAAVVMDSKNRLISGGGSVIKIWEENEFAANEQEDGDDDDTDDDDDDAVSDGSGEATKLTGPSGGRKRAAAQGPGDSDSDEPATKKMTWKERRRARKRKRVAEPAFPGID